MSAKTVVYGVMGEIEGMSVMMVICLTHRPSTRLQLQTLEHAYQQEVEIRDAPKLLKEIFL
jgi:hypothetical protein